MSMVHGAGCVCVHCMPQRYQTVGPLTSAGGPFTDPGNAERIAAAAIHLAPLTLSLPAPARHHHLIRHIALLGIGTRICSDMQGFITSDGRFVDRYEAMAIARAQGQLIPRAGGHMQGEISNGDKLFSEDVW